MPRDAPAIRRLHLVTSRGRGDPNIQGALQATREHFGKGSKRRDSVATLRREAPPSSVAHQLQLFDLPQPVQHDVVSAAGSGLPHRVKG